MLHKSYLLILGFLLVAGCAGRPQVELEIVRSEVAKAYAQGAKVLAVKEYDAASAALHDAENLVRRKKYSLAREMLNQALLHAAKASAVAKEKASALDAQRLAAKKTEIVVEKEPVTTPPVVKTAPPKKKSVPKPPAPKIVYLDEVTVSVGETLFSLSSRRDIYGEPYLWPLIYKANRDQIKDPGQIFKGQVFSIPRDKSQAELDAAREEARSSELFPR